MSEPHDLARGKMDLVDVGPAARKSPRRHVRLIVQQSVKDPIAVERNIRVGHGAVARLDQNLFAAVGLEQHQVGPGIDGHGVKYLSEASELLIAVARRPHIDDVVVVLDRLIGRDVRRVDVQDNWRLLRLGRGLGVGEQNGAGGHCKNEPRQKPQRIPSVFTGLLTMQHGGLRLSDISSLS